MCGVVRRPPMIHPCVRHIGIVLVVGQGLTTSGGDLRGMLPGSARTVRSAARLRLRRRRRRVCRAA